MSNRHPWEEERWIPGVLSKNQVLILKSRGYLENLSNEQKDYDYSAFDLHLADEGYRMTMGSVKPCGTPYSVTFLQPPFAERLTSDESGHYSLYKNNCYVFALEEKLSTLLANDPVIYGLATAKSTVGRLDVIARLIVDGMRQYEFYDPREATSGQGKLFLEIIPISFNIKVKKGISLSQLRLFYGKPKEAELPPGMFLKYMLRDNKKAEDYLSVKVQNTNISGKNVCAFRARTDIDSNDFIHLWQGEEKINPCIYWAFEEARNDRIEIKKDEFYLLRSKELISLPSSVAVYCIAMDESLGEMRIHYAGFVHPCFGHEREDGELGTPLIFEIRGHNVDVNLADGERLARLVFYRMSEDAKSKVKNFGNSDASPEVALNTPSPNMSLGQIENDYAKQDLKLSKIFDKWPNNITIDGSGIVSQIEE